MPGRKSQATNQNVLNFWVELRLMIIGLKHDPGVIEADSEEAKVAQSVLQLPPGFDFELKVWANIVDEWPWRSFIVDDLRLL